MSTSFKFVVLICAVLFYRCDISAQNNDESVMTISLHNYNPQYQSYQVFDKLAFLNLDSRLIININDVPDTEFFIIQVHSYKHNTVLSNNIDFISESFTSGTNIGLVQIVTNSNNYKFFIKNEQTNINNSIYIAVLPYQKAPIPGGCNLSFMTEIAPFQKLKYSDAVITIEAQPASIKDYYCESQIVKHQRFQMYLPEGDFSAQTYFDGIRQMLTVDNINNYGSKISKPRTNFLTQMYNTYKGTGSVYVIIANFNNSKSAYVPIVSYGCDINYPDSCENLSTTISRILCGLLVFLGLFTCYFGHKYFKTEMFLIGALVGAYIAFLILSLNVNLNVKDTILPTIGFGLLFGLLWLGFWWYYGIPVLSTLLCLFTLGFLVASVAFYFGISDLSVMNNDLTYWGFFASIVLFCMMVLTGFTDKANILASAVIGAYAFILPLDHYFGGNLKYILITTFRRFTVENFNKAVINAPFQIKDNLLVILWTSLTVSGVIYQWKQQRGRPPFPPTASRLQPPNERTPLLMPTSSVAPSDRIILIQSTPARA